MYFREAKKKSNYEQVCYLRPLLWEGVEMDQNLH